VLQGLPGMVVVLKNTYIRIYVQEHLNSAGAALGSSGTMKYTYIYICILINIYTYIYTGALDW